MTGGLAVWWKKAAISASFQAPWSWKTSDYSRNKREAASTGESKRKTSWRLTCESIGGGGIGSSSYRGDTWIRMDKKSSGAWGCVEVWATVGMSKAWQLSRHDRQEARGINAKLCCVVQPLRGVPGPWPPQNFPSHAGDVFQSPRRLELLSAIIVSVFCFWVSSYFVTGCVYLTTVSAHLFPRGRFVCLMMTSCSISQ